jgi:hypothetical protein
MVVEVVIGAVTFVAPEMLVQVELSGEDCHWKVRPAYEAGDVAPEVLRVVTNVPQPIEEPATTVPALGVPVQTG